MADKKKYHPGGTVPVRKRSLNKNTQLLKARSLAMENQIAKELGYSSKAALSTALRNASPQEQRSLNSRLTTVGNKLQKQFNIDNKQLIADRRRIDQSRRKKHLDRARRLYGDISRKQINPLMPTAGFDARQRNIRGTTPMPGPAPDSARMRRMQKLMREQQRRFNTRRGSLGNARFEPRVTAKQLKNVKNIEDVYKDFMSRTGNMSRTGRGPTGTGTPFPKNPQKLNKAKTRTDGGMPRPTRRRK